MNSVPARQDMNSVPARQEMSSAIPARQEMSSAIPARQDMSSAVPARQDMSSAIPARQDMSSAVPARQSMSSAVPARQGMSSAVPARQGMSSAVPVKQDTNPARHANKTGIPVSASSTLSRAPVPLNTASVVGGDLSGGSMLNGKTTQSSLFLSPNVSGKRVIPERTSAINASSSSNSDSDICGSQASSGTDCLEGGKLRFDSTFNYWSNSPLEDCASSLGTFSTVWNTPPIQKGDVLPDLYNLAIKIAGACNEASVCNTPATPPAASPQCYSLSSNMSTPSSLGIFPNDSTPLTPRNGYSKVSNDTPTPLCVRRSYGVECDVIDARHSSTPRMSLPSTPGGGVVPPSPCIVLTTPVHGSSSCGKSAAVMTPSSDSTRRSNIPQEGLTNEVTPLKPTKQLRRNLNSQWASWPTNANLNCAAENVCVTRPTNTDIYACNGVSSVSGGDLLCPGQQSQYITNMNTNGGSCAHKGSPALASNYNLQQHAQATSDATHISNFWEGKSYKHVQDIDYLSNDCFNSLSSEPFPPKYSNNYSLGDGRNYENGNYPWFIPDNDNRKQSGGINGLAHVDEPCHTNSHNLPTMYVSSVTNTTGMMQQQQQQQQKHDQQQAAAAADYSSSPIKQQQDQLSLFTLLTNLTSQQSAPDQLYCSVPDMAPRAGGDRAVGYVAPLPPMLLNDAPFIPHHRHDSGQVS